MNDKLKEKLVSGIIWTAVKQGGLQRARIYNPSLKVSNQEKRELRNYIRDFCFKNLYKSKTSISEKEVISIITSLTKNIESKFKPILNNGEFKFGNSQKFINLYLKLLWILDKAEEPPHFPVDRIIQKGFKPIRSWTNMDKDGYLEVIKTAKKKAQKENLTLANWELNE